MEIYPKPPHTLNPVRIVVDGWVKVNVPASSLDTGNAGEYAVDNTYLYLYTIDGWKRAAFEKW